MDSLLPPRRKRALTIAALLLVLGAGGVFGWRWWDQTRHLVATDNAYVHGNVTPVSTKLAGHVRVILVDDNQRVAKGQVLVRLDDREFRIAVRDSEARVAAARAALANVFARIEKQKATIKQSAAEVRFAEAEFNRARSEHRRITKLAARSVASRQRFDQTEAGLHRGRARLSSSRAALLAAQAELAVLSSDRERLAANLAQSFAALELAKTRLSDTVVKAPVDGVIANRTVRPGQYVVAGRTLFSVVPLKGVWVVANFKETQIVKMRRGQRVHITVDAYPGQELEGRVESFAPASGATFALLPPQNASGNFNKIVQRIPIKITLKANHKLSRRLRPGMSVNVTIDTQSAAGKAVQAARRR